MNIEVVTTRMYFAITGTIVFVFAEETEPKQIQINSFYGTEDENLDALNFVDMQQNLVGAFLNSSVVPADQRDKVQIAGVTVNGFSPLGVHADDSAFFARLRAKQAADALEAGEQALAEIDPQGEA